MVKKSTESDGFTFDYELKLDFNELGMSSSLFVKAEPEQPDAVNSAIGAAPVTLPLATRDTLHTVDDYIRRDQAGMRVKGKSFGLQPGCI